MSCPHHDCPHCARAPLGLDILQDIKALWDVEGFGSDDAVSEPLYARLSKAVEYMSRDLEQED